MGGVIRDLFKENHMITHAGRMATHAWWYYPG